jgi:hypothetical protein
VIILVKKVMRRLVSGLLPLLIILPAAAQEIIDEAEEPEIRRYRVEVIVFRYAEDVSTGSEVFLGEKLELLEVPLEEDLEITEELPEELPEELSQEPEEEPEPLPDTEFSIFAEEDFQLGEVVSMLERLDAYEPLMHFGWTQATWPEEQTEALPLQRFAEPPEGLDGSLTLYLSRFLHLVVNLQLDAEGQNEPEEETTPIYGDYRVFREYDEVVDRGPVRYRIQENRILKNGELRYYDHPKFGVLAKVTRVEEEAEDDPADAELLGYGTE